MEKDKRDKITAVLAELIGFIDCNAVLISHLQATQTFSLADERHLVALPNKCDQAKELLNILFTRTDGYKSLVEALRKTRQTGALELLKEPIQVDSSQHEIADIAFSQFPYNQPFESHSGIRRFRKISCHSREATQLFTGRGRELRILSESLLPDGGAASITGIGGIGKTELAKMFLHKLDKVEQKTVFQQIVWINCESSLSASTDFITVAKDYLKVPILGSSNQQRDLSSILSDAYDKLLNSKSLVILDNVETKEILQTYLPQPSTISKLSILITSQSLKIGTNVPLDSLNISEAVEFVKKGLNIPEPLSKEIENGILELVERLEMLPLAIVQAIGYIKDKREMHVNYGPHDYLVDVNRIPERIFDRNYFPDLSSNGKTIYKTLDLALSRIKNCEVYGTLASEILSKVAFMAPDNIPSNLFSELAENDNDAIEEALILIRRFSIIKYKPVNRNSTVYFSIHRLVQDVLRIRIHQNDQTKNSIHSTIELLSCQINHDLIDHSVETWKHASKIKNLVELFSEFPFQITKLMSEIGQISDAFVFSASALILLKQKLITEEHARTVFWLQGFNNWLLFLQGRLDDSLENLHATLGEAQNFLTDGDSVILKIEYYIARLNYESGQNDKAALICDKMYKDYTEHKTATLRPLLDIGWLQNNLKRFDDAQKTATYILAQLKLTSEQHREQLQFDTKFLIANNLGRMENYLESITLYSELFQTYKKHRKITLSNSNRWLLFHDMGTVQYYAGLFEDAHDSFQKALNEMNGQQESDCVYILKTKCNLAALMLERASVDKALPFALAVHQQTKQFFGEKNCWTFSSLGNVGVGYSKVGRHLEAVQILTQLIENEKHEKIILKYYLALSLEKIGRVGRSVEILSELRATSSQNPNFKLVTIEQVNSALNKILYK